MTAMIAGPAAVDAEIGLVGSLLLDPDRVADVLPLVSAESFTVRRLGVVFAAVAALVDETGSCDVLLLRRRLADAGHLVDADAPAAGHADAITEDWLVELAASVPTPANCGRYARVVAGRHRMRAIIAACEDAARDAADNPGEPDAVADRAESAVGLACRVGTGELGGGYGLAEAIERDIERIDRGEAVEGVPTGFVDLDKMTLGLHPGELAILAARPSMGKTALAMDIMWHMACGRGFDGVERDDRAATVGVLTAEMDKTLLISRLLSRVSGIDAQHMRRGAVDRADMPRLRRAAERILAVEHRLLVADTPGLTLARARSTIRRMARLGARVIMIDYLQLMTNPGRDRHGKTEEVASISNGLKNVCRECGVAGLVLAQLNRGPEQRADQRPRLSDLKQSGDIEQDADCVMLIHRPIKNHSSDSEEDRAWRLANPDLCEDEYGVSVAYLEVAKQRNGPIGGLRLGFSGKTTRFLDWTETGTRGAAPAGDSGHGGDDDWPPFA